MSEEEAQQLRRTNKELASTTENFVKRVKILHKISHVLVKKSETSGTTLEQLREKCQNLETMVKSSEISVEEQKYSNKDLATKLETSNSCVFILEMSCAI
ncbi:unnamed protein product [Tetraodon nigroviridis]|uniref:(spotted green pufferfish) hypothetical protein n=1 Tax=Tetraodon nigroviridis TaxID=99883 RepID=Q4SNV1_TETNG|nr:unnamed protein product [Tetraodon nigroviridis]